MLSRAVGLDPRVLMDFADGELMLNDRFLLVSDGVWRAGRCADGRSPARHPEPRAAAAALTSLALAHGGRDNATAVVIDVLALLPASLRDTGRAPLACPCRIARVGHEIDGLVVESAARRPETLLYRVRNRRNGQQLWCSRRCSRRCERCRRQRRIADGGGGPARCFALLSAGHAVG